MSSDSSHESELSSSGELAPSALRSHSDKSKRKFDPLESSSDPKRQKLIGFPRETWNAKRVTDWLHTTVFGAPYLQNFVDLKVDGKKLATLDVDALENEFGVSNKLHRLRFKRVIDQLRKQSTIPQPLDDENNEPLPFDDVPNWDAKQVYRWLGSLSFGEMYKMNFLTYGVDGKALIRLDDQTLEEELSVDKSLVRKRYLRAIKELSPSGSWEEYLEENAAEEESDSEEETVRKQPPRSAKKRRRRNSRPATNLVSEWSCSQVCEWLKTLDFAEPFVKSFEEKKVNGPTLFRLTHVDLEQGLGITSKMIRSRFLRDIEKLREENPDTRSNLFATSRPTSRPSSRRRPQHPRRPRRQGRQHVSKLESVSSEKHVQVHAVSHPKKAVKKSKHKPAPRTVTVSPKPLDISEVFGWKNNDVIGWLKTHNFALPYVSAFRAQKTNGVSLMMLDDTTLEGLMKIKSPIVREEFLKAIDKIRPPAPKMEIDQSELLDDSLPFDVNEWTPHDVQQWLKTIRIHQGPDMPMNNDINSQLSRFVAINGVTLMRLTHEKLTDLGLTSFYTREIILQEIKKQKFRDARRCPITEWDCETVDCWIHDIIFGRVGGHFAGFVDKDVTGQMLVGMTDDKLASDFAVASPEARRQFLEAVQTAIMAHTKAAESADFTKAEEEDSEEDDDDKGDNIPLSQWQAPAVAQWIRSLECGMGYADRFEEHQITGAQLIELVGEDLEKRLSINDESHRKLLLKEITRLSTESKWSISPPSSLSKSSESSTPLSSVHESVMSGAEAVAVRGQNTDGSGGLQTTPAGTAKLFVCAICGKAYVKEATLITHHAEHSHENVPYPITCMYCSRRFKKEVAKIQHEKIHFRSPGVRPESNSPYMITLPTSTPTGGPEGGTSMKSSTPTITNVHSHHTTNGDPTSTFASSMHLQDHSHSHSHSHLHQHQHPHSHPHPHPHHRDIKLNPNELGENVFSVLYTCKTPRCQKSFKDKEELDSHESNCMASYASLPSECPLCKERFGSASQMTHHLATHTQPFKCLICNSQFSTKSHLDTHVVIAHPNAHQETATRADLTPRMRFSREEIEQLEAYYAKHNHPPTEERRRIAQQMGIDHNRVTNWFSNRRQKAKRIVRQNTNGDSSLVELKDSLSSASVAANTLSAIQGGVVQTSSTLSFPPYSMSSHHQGSVVITQPAPGAYQSQSFQTYQTLASNFGAPYPAPRTSMNSTTQSQTYSYQQGQGYGLNSQPQTVAVSTSATASTMGGVKTSLYGLSAPSENLGTASSASSGMVNWEQNT